MRPYLFSNTVAPVIVAGAIKLLDTLSQSTDSAACEASLTTKAAEWEQVKDRIDEEGSP